MRLYRSVHAVLAGTLLGWLATHSSGIDVESGQAYEPLTEQEIKTINRLLGDPTAFPRAFKKWVTDHASDSVDIAKSQVHGLINSSGQLVFSAQNWEQLGAAFCPMILPYPATVAPKGWFTCEGQMISQTDYSILFGYLGHQFDVNSSPGNFALPDLRGRAIYGYDPVSGGQTMPYGSHEGSQAGGRGPWHSHIVNIPEMINVGTQLETGSYWPRFSPQSNDFQTSSGPGGNTTVRRNPSYLALNYIIASGRMPD